MRRELWLSGVRLPSATQSDQAGMAPALHAKVEATHGVISKAQGSVSATPVAAGRSGRSTDQSGVAGLGQLLCRRACQRVLQFHPRLGREEGTTPHGAIP